MKFNKILLLGASGFLGQYLYYDFRRAGISVVPVVRNTQLAPIPFGTLSMSFNDANLLIESILSNSIDIIIDAAATGAYSWQDSPDEIFRGNYLDKVDFVDRLIDSGWRGLYINLGSSSEYGFNSDRPSELAREHPNSHYAVSKLAFTNYLAWKSSALSEFSAFTLRLYSMYGPYENPARLIPKLIKCTSRGFLPDLASEETERDYTYVGDLADFLRYLVQPNVAKDTVAAVGGILNFGTGTTVTLRDLVSEILRLRELSIEPKFGAFPSRPWDTKRWRCNRALLDKIGREFASTSLAEGLSKTISFSAPGNSYA